MLLSVDEIGRATGSEHILNSAIQQESNAQGERGAGADLAVEELGEVALCHAQQSGQVKLPWYPRAELVLHECSETLVLLVA